MGKQIIHMKSFQRMSRTTRKMSPQLESLWHIGLNYLLYVIILPTSKTCDNYVMRLCNVIKYFSLILLQFEIICVLGHPGRTYMSSWFCYAKLGATAVKGL